MLSGCVQQVFFPHVNAATARVLAAEGCEVVVPREQPAAARSCSTPAWKHEAAALAKKMIAAFEAASVDTIVINSAGCGSTMKEYGYLLRDDPAWAERAAAFSAKCKDISEILVRARAAGRRAIHSNCASPITMPAICSTRRACANSRAACWPAIPDLEVAEIPESSLCCGSAGVYNLLRARHSRTARRPQSRESAVHGRAGRGLAPIPAACCN